jgi:hypothetical protein
MAFVERQVSSSKSRAGDRRKTGKGGAQKVKSNAAKRGKLDDELKELQASVDSFVKQINS